MKYLPLALALALAAPAWAEDYAELRACIAETEAASDDPIFHYCTAQLANACGAEKTAAKAAACIDGAAEALGAAIATGREAILTASPDKAEDVNWYLDETRANTDAQCESMASDQAKQGLPEGQRAVNNAFCRLIATGDVFAALTRLEKVE